MTSPAALLSSARPQLVPHVTPLHRTIRGDAWVVLTNELTGEHMRLNNAAWNRVKQFDGAQPLCAPGEDLDSELMNLVLGLHQRSMLTLGLENESQILLALQKQTGKRRVLQRWFNPLYLRFPLFDPDDYLEKCASWFAFLFHRYTLYTLLLVFLVALTLGLTHFRDIMQTIEHVASSPVHWWLYLLLYPILKIIHEAAHAICVKHWGGEVHETGITLLVLFPLPYVNASDAWRFVERHQRLLVNASGMLAEGFVAAIALIFWCLVDDGAVRDFAFAVAVLGSVSTLLFNANPLLKFDGYFLLQDYLDIPNLGSRANGYYTYLIRRYLFNVNAVSPVTATGEQRWFLIYGALAWLYRWFIFFVIGFMLIDRYHLFGALLLSMALIQLIILPLWKSWNYLRSSDELVGKRIAAVQATTLIVGLGLFGLGFVPLPSSTRAEGVLWVPAQAQVFAGEAGFVVSQLAAAGETVRTGQPLFRLKTPELTTQATIVDAMLRGAEVEYREAQQKDPGRARSLNSERSNLQSHAQNLQMRIGQLDVKAASDGRFTPRSDQILMGSHVPKGELLGYVVNSSEYRVRAVVPERSISKLQHGVSAVSVRLADRFGEPVAAELIRQTPAANNQLPSPSLAYDGQSGIVVASEEDGLKTRERVFHIELALPAGLQTAGIGGQAYVTLTHPWETLGARLWRSTRQLFLKKLAV